MRAQEEGEEKKKKKTCAIFEDKITLIIYADMYKGITRKKLKKKNRKRGENKMSENLNVKISDLIQVAQNYVDSAKVDEDNSGTINSNKELNRLLAGTAATSIEDLTVENIKQKMLENDTEKIFTAFMTEKTLTTTSYFSIYSNTIRGIYIEDVKDHISNTKKWSTRAMDYITKDADNIKDNLKELNNINDENNVQKYIETLKKIKENLNDIEYQFTRYYDFGGGKKYGYYFGQRPLTYDGYEEGQLMTNGLYEADVETIKNMRIAIESQIQALESNEKSPSECLSELQASSEQIDAVKYDFKKMKNYFEYMLEKDIEFMNKLETNMAQFIADGVASEEEKKKAKELLGELIEQVSPWSRNLLLQQAEAAYKYDKDYNSTTGIDSPKVEVNGKEYEVGKQYQEKGPDGKPRIVSYDRLGNKWDISHGGVKVND